MAIGKYGLAHMAAAQVTRRSQAAVAAKYVAWLEHKASLDLAMDSLCAAMFSSRNADRVLVNADAYYTSIAAEDAADDPTITGALSPTGGVAAGGTVVTINGTNLDRVTGVTFGGTAGTSLVKVSKTQIRITSPAHAAGAVNVVVTGDNGTATKTNGFTYS